jgi:hypothetical protein
MGVFLKPPFAAPAAAPVICRSNLKLRIDFMAFVHWGAGQIADRTLQGGNTPENRSLVYRWAREPPERSPIPIRKVGGTLVVYESDLADYPFPPQPAKEDPPLNEPTTHRPAALAASPRRMARPPRQAGKEKAPSG